MKMSASYGLSSLQKKKHTKVFTTQMSKLPMLTTHISILGFSLCSDTIQHPYKN